MRAGEAYRTPLIRRRDVATQAALPATFWRAGVGAIQLSTLFVGVRWTATRDDKTAYLPTSYYTFPTRDGRTAGRDGILPTPDRGCEPDRYLSITNQFAIIYRTGRTYLCLTPY